jgi:hypothetical protein
MIRAFGAHCQDRTHAVQQEAPLLNHVVGAGEQRGRDVEAERFRGLEIDNQLVFGGLLHGQVGWFGALENLVDVESRAPMEVIDVRTITHETAHDPGKPGRADDLHEENYGKPDK